MPDTRSLPRGGPIQVAPNPLPAMFFDNWPVCPARGCGVSERDGLVEKDYANDLYRCSNGHLFTDRTALWEVDARRGRLALSSGRRVARRRAVSPFETFRGKHGSKGWEEYGRFEDLLREVLQVPKSEVDQLRAESDLAMLRPRPPRQPARVSQVRRWLRRRKDSNQRKGQA